MTKSDLKSGMVIETRNEERFLSIERSGAICFMNLNGCVFFTSDRMHEDMTMPHPHENLDILRVFAPCTTLNDCKTTKYIMWERKEPKKMTVAEIEKALGYTVKIVKEEHIC